MNRFIAIACVLAALSLPGCVTKEPTVTTERWQGVITDADGNQLTPPTYNELPPPLPPLPPMEP